MEKLPKGFSQNIFKISCVVVGDGTIKLFINNQLVKEKLQKITDSAKTNENLMPLIIDAALEYATLGEIVDSMKSVFGEWQEKAVI